jgi:hypothetical protein
MYQFQMAFGHVLNDITAWNVLFGVAFLYITWVQFLGKYPQTTERVLTDCHDQDRCTGYPGERM